LGEPNEGRRVTDGYRLRSLSLTPVNHGFAFAQPRR